MQTEHHLPPGPHERHLTEHFGEANLRSKTAIRQEPVRAVFICATQRTGSNRLAELLASTGKLPLGFGAFGWSIATKVSARHSIKSFEDYCALVAREKSVNGWLVAKVSWDQFFFLTKLGLLSDLFSSVHVIHLQRQDILDQAISFLIARQTRKWTSTMSGEPTTPEYSDTRIKARIAAIRKANHQFSRYADEFGLIPYRLVYENFIKDESGQVSSIMEWLGLGPSSIDLKKAVLEPQRSAINDEWKARYLRSHPDYVPPTSL